jgi:hypothetical protein
MGEAGRGIVNPAFELQVMVERISDVYKESIEERGGVFKWRH